MCVCVFEKDKKLEIVFHFHNKYISLIHVRQMELKFIMEMEYYF